MNTVDSCGWLEYFAEGLNAQLFAPAIEDVENLVVPSITIDEEFKRILQRPSEHEALQAIALMQPGKVDALTITVALGDAKVSSTLTLPLADSIVLAAAQAFNATLWTRDADYKGSIGVNIVRKR